MDPREGITVRPKGGLGNHLFSFGAGLAKARTLGVPLFVELQKSNSPSSASRELLKLFGELPGVCFVQLGGLRSAFFRARKSACGTWVQGLSHDSPSSWDHIRPGTILEGYLQVASFVEPALAEMSRFLSNKGFFRSSSLGDEVFGPGDIAINIRRGDYEELSVKKIHGVLPSSYYADAENYLRSLSLAGTAWLTSDSKELRTKSPEYFSRKWLEDEELSPSSLMELLAKAPGLVISNSTFGWWSAAFGTSLFNQVVCVPSAWKLNQPDAISRLMLEGWHKVPTALEA